MSESTPTQKLSLSLPLLPILTIIFVAAKVFFGFPITWLWAFSPLWLPLAVLLGVAILALAVFAIIAVAGWATAKF